MSMSVGGEGSSNLFVELTPISEVCESPGGSSEATQSNIETSVQRFHSSKHSTHTPQSFFSKLRRQFPRRFFRRESNKNRCMIETFPVCSSEPTSSSRSESEDGG